MRKTTVLAAGAGSQSGVHPEMSTAKRIQQIVSESWIWKRCQQRHNSSSNWYLHDERQPCHIGNAGMAVNCVTHRVELGKIKWRRERKMEAKLTKAKTPDDVSIKCANLPDEWCDTRVSAGFTVMRNTYCGTASSPGHGESMINSLTGMQYKSAPRTITGVHWCLRAKCGAILPPPRAINSPVNANRLR